MGESEHEELSLKNLEGISSYIDVLVDCYPEPISRAQLAEKVGVSKPAITKVSNRLLGLCDHNKLIFGHKLILRTDDVSTKLLVLYVRKLKPGRILKSRYGLAVLRKIGIHSKICEGFPQYAMYFDESDTEAMIKIFLHNFDNLRIEDKIRATIEGIQSSALSISMNYIEAFGVLVNQFDLPMKTKEDLIAILRVRDKGFLLAKQLIVDQIGKASIMESLAEADKAKYMDVYSQTVSFYLRKVLGTFTDLAATVAQRRGIEFREEYRMVGSIYSTERIISF